MNKNDMLNLLVGLVSVIAGITTASLKVLPALNSQENSSFYILTLACLVALAAFSAFFSIYLSNKNKRKDRIFISYNEKDRDKAIEIANRIKDFGYKPWIDINEILPGQNTFDEIKKSIENSAVFLLILSENYNSSFVAKELELAMSIMRSHDKSFSPVLPVIIRDIPVSSIPESLKSIQWLDLRKNEEEGYKNLKEGLQRILGKDN